MLSQDNTPVAAIYGFIKSLSFMLRMITTKQEAILLTVALDVGKGENFRYQIYSEYKGNRSSTPEDLIVQLKLAKPMLDAFGIKYVSDATCEADDVIATYAKQAAANGYKVVIVSSDKDLMQLISDEIMFFDIIKKSYCSAEDVYEKFLVGPHQICDYLSMVGDRADNIPGIRGIGKQSAAKLLGIFDSLDGIYDNLNKISDIKTKKMLENGYELAMLSKRLVTLNENIPTVYRLEEMKWNGFNANIETIKEFLYTYSLESLIRILK